MRVTFQFHPDNGPAHEVELRDPTELTVTLLQANAGRPEGVLQMPYWIDGEFRGPGLFRASRISNVQIH